MTQKLDMENIEENSKYKDGVNRNARLIVRNISFKATEESLRDHFKPYGTVEEVKLLKRPDGKLVGCGFVHFTQVPMANEALAATNRKPFLGRPLNVAWAVTKQKYEEKLQANGPRKPNSSESNHDSKIFIKKEPIKSAISDGNVDKNKQQQRVNRNARLIVRNISFKATEDTLKQHFEPYGELLEVKLLKKPDGKLVGCAFVHYKNVPMAKKALLSTNMKPFLGRPISVDWAVAKDKYMKHVVEKQLELHENVKKEESDSDEEEAPPINISNEAMKDEVKSESDESDGDVKSEEDDEDEADSDDDDDDDVDVDEDNKNEDNHPPERKRVVLNDAEDGRTVFVSELPFSVDGEALRRWAGGAGGAGGADGAGGAGGGRGVLYALVCTDPLTEHSRGSGFVKFETKEDADSFLSLPPEELKLEGQTVVVRPALKRENLRGSDKKQPKDNRNLYLVKEGVVVAGTKAAVGVSASDMAKRLALERSKTQMLKNLNRFVSRYRVVVSNLPARCDDARLRALAAQATRARPGAVVTEARVMRDLRAAPDSRGVHPSKGYGFVMFNNHEDALMCLRKLNNNPDIFDKNNRPIVSFSIEDRTALNARKKRLEKSIANNPLANKNDDNLHPNQKGYRKRKNIERPDESKIKKGKFDNRNKDKQNGGSQKQFNKNRQTGKFVRPNNNEEIGEYSGLTAKEGSQHKIRSNFKLKQQAEVHRQNSKVEKKMNKRTQRLKMAAKERIKQPKQKINKNPKKNNNNITDKKVKAALKQTENFTDLVSKYKSKLVGNSLDRVKVKWYEQ